MKLTPFLAFLICFVPTTQVLKAAETPETDTQEDHDIEYYKHEMQILHSKCNFLLKNALEDNQQINILKRKVESYRHMQRKLEDENNGYRVDTSRYKRTIDTLRYRLLHSLPRGANTDEICQQLIALRLENNEQVKEIKNLERQRKTLELKNFALNFRINIMLREQKEGTDTPEETHSKDAPLPSFTPQHSESPIIPYHLNPLSEEDIQGRIKKIDEN